MADNNNNNNNKGNSDGGSPTDILNNQNTIQSDGINTNLGKFVSHAKSQEKAEVASIQQQADNKDVPEVKIDFAKFERQRRQKKQTKLDIKLGGWLSNKKTLIRIWVLAILAIIFFITIQTVYYVYIQKINHGWTHNHNGGKWPAKALYPHVDVAAKVFALISMCLPVIPLFYLFIAAIVGINGIISSKTYHYVLWTILALCGFCFVLSTCLSLTFIIGCITFNPPYV